MVPFDFETENWEEENADLLEERNPYLADPTQGLELVRTLLKRYPQGEQASKEVRALEEKLFPLLAWLDLEKGTEYYQRLVKICGRMQEKNKLEFLDGKVVLGIGGRFSAGKSCFINSITNAQLPENQRETTSIATYVMKQEQKQSIAHTIGGGRIELEDQAVQALTHQFYDTYHIGFSRVIQQLVICSPSFQYPNIAILDTPGYNKADGGKMKEATDAETARRQLETADYLIWLLDIENGELKADDEKFIDALKITNPGLIVFNKAGIVTLEKAQAIVENTAARLESSGRTNYTVIAYDSVEGETIVGGDALERFLTMVNKDSQKRQSIQDQLDQLGRDICASIDESISLTTKQISQVEKAIVSAVDTGKIQSLIDDYILRQGRKKKLLDARYSVLATLQAQVHC